MTEVIKTQISYEGGITKFEVRNAETNELIGYDFVSDEVEE
jgi:hypothetical protein